MKFIKTKLNGAYLIEPQVFEDERGYDEKEDEHYPSLDDTPDPQ